MKNSISIKRLGLCAIGGLVLASTAFAAPAALPGNSSAFGRGLAAWQDAYQRWVYGETSYPLDANHNVVLSGNTILMPTPPVPGDGTPGELSVTLFSGQSFLLPVWNILGTSYNDGTPNDPMIGLSVFQTLNIRLEVDGVKVADSSNVMDYYAQFTFDPPSPLPPEWSPYMALVWLQGIMVAHQPLTPGVHVIKLDVENTEPVVDVRGIDWYFRYHNTWNVTVVHGRG